MNLAVGSQYPDEHFKLSEQKIGDLIFSIKNFFFRLRIHLQVFLVRFIDSKSLFENLGMWRVDYLFRVFLTEGIEEFFEVFLLS